MSVLSPVPFNHDDTCSICLGAFSDDNNPPMKHAGEGMKHAAIHKFCWREWAAKKPACPSCHETLNVSSLYSRTEKMQDAGLRFLANASIVGIAAIATVAANGAELFPPVRAAGQVLAGMAIAVMADTMPAPTAALAGWTLFNLAGYAAATALQNPSLAFGLGTPGIGCAIRLIASTIPKGDSNAVLGGFASIVVLTGLGASALPAALVGGAVAGTAAVWKRLSGLGT